MFNSALSSINLEISANCSYRVMGILKRKLPRYLMYWKHITFTEQISICRSISVFLLVWEHLSNARSLFFYWVKCHVTLFIRLEVIKSVPSFLTWFATLHSDLTATSASLLSLPVQLETIEDDMQWLLTGIPYSHTGERHLSLVLLWLNIKQGQKAYTL